MSRHMIAVLAVALLPFAPALAAGPSIAGDTFTVDLDIDDTASASGITSVGPFSSVANAINDNYYSNADLKEFFTVDAVDYDLRINWVDGDSFDLFLNGFGAIDLTKLAVRLSSLDIAAGAGAMDIIGASFNRSASNVDEYAAGPSMSSPSVTFTTRSVTASFGYFPAGLVADGPRLRFDVQVAAVPEPGTYALMGLGLGLVALRGRRGPRLDPAKALVRA